jgi:ABC-2 type transport system permease protein
MFGVPVALDDPGGFTVWRTGTVLAVLLAAWGALATTRITRGEEDAGRWDLLLAGPLTIAGVLRRQLAVLVAIMVAAGVAVAMALIAAGAGASGALLQGCGLALIGVFGVGVAAAAAQAFPARPAATGTALGVLAAGLLTRMVSDGFAGLAWLHWLTPFGLVELSGPYAAGRRLPLVVLACVDAATLAVAVLAAGGRDIRSGRIRTRTRRPPRLLLLGSVTGFAMRRAVRATAGWSAALGAFFLLIGLVAASLTQLLRDNPRFAELAARAGFVDLASPQRYAAALFWLLALVAGGFVAVRLASFAADEAAGRLTLPLAGPVTRLRAVSAEMLAAAGGAVVLAVTAGTAIWAGDSRLGFPAALAGAVNVLPVAAVSLGAAVCALGLLPRAVAAVGVLPAVGGFLLVTAGELVRVPAWLRWLSPYRHLAPVPATGVDWPGVGGLVAVALALGLAGLAGFRRRDLRG